MLFGHQDDARSSDTPTTAPSVDTPQGSVVDDTNPLAVDPATGVSLPVAPSDPVAALATQQEEPSVLDQPSIPSPSEQSPFATDPAPATPFGSDQADPTNNPAVITPDPTSPILSTPSLDADVAAPQPDLPTMPVQPFAAATPTNDQVSSSVDSLLSIKQQALSQLGPLVSHLDQTPEEKFRTTMMLIQSTDNSSLLKEAYEAAQSIPDEKIRAQALLDVVNEINYFTQQPNSSN